MATGYLTEEVYRRVPENDVLIGYAQPVHSVRLQ